MNNQIVKFLLEQIQTISKVVVTRLTTNTYKVNVEDMPPVSGKVEVTNWGQLEKAINQSLNKGTPTNPTSMTIQSVGTLMAPNIGKEVTVRNFKDFPQPIFKVPETVTIKNPQEDVRVNNIDELVEAIRMVERKISTLRLDPKITVPQPHVTVNPTPVNIPQMKLPDFPEMEKLKGENPKEYIPVRLTDGEKFYEALLSVSSGLRKETTVKNIDPLGVYQIADKDTADDTKYYGFTDKDGNWYIMQEDSVEETYRYIAGGGSYDANWGNRATLEYDYFHNVF